MLEQQHCLELNHRPQARRDAVFSGAGSQENLETKVLLLLKLGLLVHSARSAVGNFGSNESVWQINNPGANGPKHCQVAHWQWVDCNPE